MIQDDPLAVIANLLNEEEDKDEAIKMMSNAVAQESCENLIQYFMQLYSFSSNYQSTYWNETAS